MLPGVSFSSLYPAFLFRHSIAKNFDSCQPALNAQADMGRNFWQRYQAPFSAVSGL